MDGADAENKAVQPITAVAASVLENDYFYPEANGFQAITVRAATLQDAQAIYLAKRQPVDPGERSEEQKTNNE